jgi:hypothetical protein
MHEGQTMRRNGYLNGVLTVIAVLLGLLVLDARPGAGPAAARAQSEDQPGEGAGLISAGEQRKQMIAELRRISARLERLDARLNAVLNVKVTEMPAVKLTGDAGDKPGG